MAVVRAMVGSCTVTPAVVAVVAIRLHAETVRASEGEGRVATTSEDPVSGLQNKNTAGSTMSTVALKLAEWDTKAGEVMKGAAFRSSGSEAR